MMSIDKQQLSIAYSECSTAFQEPIENIKTEMKAFFCDCSVFIEAGERRLKRVIDKIANDSNVN